MMISYNDINENIIKSVTNWNGGFFQEEIDLYLRGDKI